MSQQSLEAQPIEPALYVVSTPIGNLGDISARALQVLQGVALVAAEDTRHSGALLRHFGISTPLVAYHDHSDRGVAAQLLSRIEQGESVALVSDAGTPLIADPGFRLVAQARARQLAVVPVPGPSALLAALSVSGMPTDRFVFAGFLPAKAGQRRRKLDAMAGESGTMVFYEAPHRVLETLADMSAVFGSQRQAFMARELTKQFETLTGDTLAGLVDSVQRDSNQQRGEIVLVVAGATPSGEDAGGQQLAHTLAVLMRALPLKQAVALAVEITGASRNRAYELALSMRNAD